MICRHCNTDYHGLACPCFLDRAATEKYNLGVSRFLAGEISARLHMGHAFVLIEANGARALCGLKTDKRIPADVLHVGVKDVGPACVECLGRMGK